MILPPFSLERWPLVGNALTNRRLGGYSAGYGQLTGESGKRGISGWPARISRLAGLAVEFLPQKRNRV